VVKEQVIAQGGHSKYYVHALNFFGLTHILVPDSFGLCFVSLYHIIQFKYFATTFEMLNNMYCTHKRSMRTEKKYFDCSMNI
jgi:hypothetical protein